MRFAGRVFLVVAVVAAVVILLSASSDSPVVCFWSGGVMFVSGGLSYFCAWRVDRRPCVPVHGPVLKWGYSEDAMQKKFHDPDMQRAWEEIIAAEKEDNR